MTDTSTRQTMAPAFSRISYQEARCSASMMRGCAKDEVASDDEAAVPLVDDGCLALVSRQPRCRPDAAMDSPIVN